MESDGGSPRQLTADPADEHMPTWSRDGRWIYFSSDRGGRLDIWRTAVYGRTKRARNEWRQRNDRVRIPGRERDRVSSGRH